MPLLESSNTIPSQKINFSKKQNDVQKNAHHIYYTQDNK